jgi:transcriptional regulator of nitric oxide reductase
LVGIIVTIGVRSAFYYKQETLRTRLELCIRVLHPFLLFTLLVYLLWLYG